MKWWCWKQEIEEEEAGGKKGELELRATAEEGKCD